MAMELLLRKPEVAPGWQGVPGGNAGDGVGHRVCRFLCWVRWGEEVG